MAKLLTCAGRLLRLGGKIVSSDPVVPHTGPWFASPGGSAANPGTETGPWSLQHALSGAGGLVKPGHRIKLLSGTYSVPNGLTAIGGATQEPLIVELDPAAVVDFSIPEFWQSPQTAWEPVTINGVALYRSTAEYPALSAWVGGQINLSGDWFLLAPHKTLDHLASPSAVYSGTGPYYIGPGICWSNNRLYVRLDDLPPSVLLDHTARSVGSSDPRDHALRISGQDYGLTFSQSNVRLEGTGTLLGAWSLLRATALSNIEIDGPRMHPQYVAGRFGNCSGVTFRNTYVNGGLRPDTWIDYRSIKGGMLAADHARTFGLDVTGTTDVLLEDDCVWEHLFDGCLGASYGLTMYGTWSCWDDAYQMGYACRNVQIGCNPDKLTRFYGAGPSRDGGGAGTSNPDPGTVYVGHAVIDPSRYPIFWGREGAGDNSPAVSPGVRYPIPLSTHGQPGAGQYSWLWKLYHLTVVIPGKQFSSYINIAPFRSEGSLYESEHHVKNCIFQFKEPSDIFNACGRTFVSNSGREHYDGNVYSGWIEGLMTLFRVVETSTGTIAANNGLETLTELYASQAYADSLVYSTGWETSGLMLDAQLDEDYVAHAPEVLTGAVDLTGTGWPGTAVYKASRGCR